jgi:hypothetical protein
MWRRWQQANPDKCRHYANTRRAKKIRAIPPWFEEEQVAKVYEMATEYGFHVDHIVPLNSETVCGLHCWANLQLLSKEVNASKGNRHWPDMPEEILLP